MNHLKGRAARIAMRLEEQVIPLLANGRSFLQSVLNVVSLPERIPAFLINLGFVSEDLGIEKA
jgi:hypothetical protein